MSNAAAAALTEQDRFVLHHFATDAARAGGTAGNLNCYSAEQLNRIIAAGVVAYSEARWSLTAEGERVVTAYRNRPDVRRNAARAARAMRRHPSA